MGVAEVQSSVAALVGAACTRSLERESDHGCWAEESLRGPEGRRRLTAGELITAS